MMTKRQRRKSRPIVLVVENRAVVLEDNRAVVTAICNAPNWVCRIINALWGHHKLTEQTALSSYDDYWTRSTAQYSVETTSSVFQALTRFDDVTGTLGSLENTHLTRVDHTVDLVFTRLSEDRDADRLKVTDPEVSV